jgi:hypothetical protein
MIDNYDWSRLESLGFDEKTIQELNAFDFSSGLTRRRRAKREEDNYAEKMKDDPCWSGYQMVGMKKKGKKGMVPNCVPLETKHKEGDLATAEMTPNFLPKEPGKGDEKNPEMGEGVPVRMPRMEVLKKLNDKDGQLAMAARPNYSESEDFIESNEPNGGMAINQLRVMREKIDIMLGMLYPDDNLEPWQATKLTMSTQNLASVADSLRFGVET